MFDEEYVKNLPSDKWEAISIICEKIMGFHNEIPKDEIMKYHNDFIVAFALLEIYSKAHNIRFERPEPEGISMINIQNIYKYATDFRRLAMKKIKADKTENVLDNARDRYKNMLNLGFSYTFSEGDLRRIQELINELGELISTSKDLENEHKQRLLSKLEKLQSEFHKKISNLDRFWGFLIEASITIGLMGENVKPMVDRIKELVDIIWPVQTRAYELPSNLPFKLLSQSEKEKDKK